ncbi:thioredoxin domain-containing protein [Desulfonatronum sp. SC1]|uniref:DsbA family protein n=1 Tax=Desulfonatronum sp. SC1 TaxID=2109626 RepID=UPI000D2F75A0|nr:thioredoxin domain-containing protein [Desulfonatronum sp. SC1]PTN37570.1 disulfide bond formation protein DsbA [Desulfonatronum sp. SC1]
MIKTLRLSFFVPALAFVSCWLAPQAVDARDTAGSIAPSEVRELLAAHPELVLDVLRDNPVELVEILEQAVMAKREADQRRQEQADLAMERNPEVSSDRPIRGNPDAAVTIVEYSDFLCPYCSQATETVKRLMALDQAGELRLMFKHLPLNPVSHELALAYEAAALQSHEAAWELHDRLFEQQGRLRGGAEALLQEIVAELGIDPERFTEDRKRPELVELIQADMDEARKFGFSGTPMFLVNGIPLRGAVPLSEFQRVIELAKTRDSSVSD